MKELVEDDTEGPQVNAGGGSRVRGGGWRGGERQWFDCCTRALQAEAAIAAEGATCGCMAFPEPARAPCTGECPRKLRQHRSKNQNLNPVKESKP